RGHQRPFLLDRFLLGGLVRPFRYGGPRGAGPGPPPPQLGRAMVQCNNLGCAFSPLAFTVPYQGVDSTARRRDRPTEWRPSAGAREKVWLATKLERRSCLLELIDRRAGTTKGITHVPKPHPACAGLRYFRDRHSRYVSP